MNRMCRALADESGSIIVLATILTIAAVATVFAVYYMASLDASLAAQDVRSSQALYVAESGLERGLSWLRGHGQPPAGTTLIHPCGLDTFSLAGGSCGLAIRPDSSNGSSWRHKYTVLSEGTVGQQSRCLELDVQTQLFSDFVYFTSFEHMPGGGNPLWFHSHDVISGPLFTNDQISIFGDPTFRSMVYSAYGGPGDKNANHEPLFLYYNGSSHDHIESAAAHNAPHDNPVFADGYQLGASVIEYPSLPLVYELKEVARQGGVSVAGNYDFVLSRPDDQTGQPMYGYISYFKPGQGWVDVDISSTNGVVFVNGNLTVSGVLDGELTISTNGNITIVDDIVYRGSDDSGPLPDCDDVLGLVAGSDIIVADNAPNSSDCVIHAAMMALDNSFAVEKWGSGEPRGDLTVHGSIIQNFRGPIGTGQIVGGEPVVLTGYAKDYHYDWRLQTMYPPEFYRFMQTGDYARLEWREIVVAG